MPIAIKPSAHTIAVLQALLVTFLWATSWVLIKIGLADIPALTFAGLRYSLAALCLLTFVLARPRHEHLRSLAPRMWGKLAVLGLLFIAVTQGAQFLGLAYLPAVTVNLLLNFTSVIVALLGVMLLREHPTRTQWLGIILTLVDATVYFHPVAFPASQAACDGIQHHQQHDAHSDSHLGSGIPGRAPNPATGAGISTRPARHIAGATAAASSNHPSTG